MGDSTTDRGYGWSHQQERESWRPDVEAGLVDCWRCFEAARKDPRIYPWQPWDLGHDDEDRSKYRGPEHRWCNRGAAGERAALVRGWVWKRRAGREHQELSVDPADL